VTIPHPSCPLCCKACSPKAVRAAASLLLKMPKTPHSSFNYAI